MTTFFFSRPVVESEFFSESGFTVTADAKNVSEKREEDLFNKGLINAARAVCVDTSVYLRPVHAPQPMTLSVVEGFKNYYGLNRYHENSRYPFRDERQFQPMAAFNCYAVWGLGYPVRKPSLRQYARWPKRPRSLGGRLKRFMIGRHYPASFCINEFAREAERVPDLERWLSKVTGPPAPFEV